MPAARQLIEYEFRKQRSHAAARGVYTRACHNFGPSNQPGIYEETTDEESVRGGSRYLVDPAHRGADFRTALGAAARAHPYGAAVTVHPEEYYQDPSHKLFLNREGTAGAAVDRHGNVFSVFSHPHDVTHEIRTMFSEVATHGTSLDCFDVRGKLPTWYALYGFVPVARVKFDDEYAPEGWNYEKLGRPDIVLMAKKPGSAKPTIGDYNEIRDQVPIMSMDDALLAQAAAVDQFTREETSSVRGH